MRGDRHSWGKPICVQPKRTSCGRIHLIVHIPHHNLGVCSRDFQLNPAFIDVLIRDQFIRAAIKRTRLKGEDFCNGRSIRTALDVGVDRDFVHLQCTRVVLDLDVALAAVVFAVDIPLLARQQVVHDVEPCTAAFEVFILHRYLLVARGTRFGHKAGGQQVTIGASRRSDEQFNLHRFFTKSGVVAGQVIAPPPIVECPAEFSALGQVGGSNLPNAIAVGVDLDVAAFAQRFAAFAIGGDREALADAPAEVGGGHGAYGVGARAGKGVQQHIAAGGSAVAQEPGDVALKVVLSAEQEDAVSAVMCVHRQVARGAILFGHFQIFTIPVGAIFVSDVQADLVVARFGWGPREFRVDDLQHTVHVPAVDAAFAFGQVVEDPGAVFNVVGVIGLAASAGQQGGTEHHGQHQEGVYSFHLSGLDGRQLPPGGSLVFVTVNPHPRPVAFLLGCAKTPFQRPNNGCL